MSDELTPLSPDDLVSGRALPPDMVRDLRAMAALDEKAVAALADALHQEEGILSEVRVSQLVEQFFGDGDGAKAVQRAVLSAIPEQTQYLLTLFNRWRTSSENRRELMPDELFAVLKRNVETLVQDYRCLVLMRKARRLLRDTGNEFDEALFICDLRPIFDLDHSRVEGFVSLATLRLRFTRQNGERDVFEIALTEAELSNLVEQAQDALDKLTVLKEAVPNMVE